MAVAGAFTVAQMVAVLSADSTQLEKRLDKVESLLLQTAQNAEDMRDAIEKAATGSATSLNKLLSSAEDTERGLANLAEFEYRTGKKSAEDYSTFLSQRMNAFNTFESEWRSSALRMAAVDADIERKKTAQYKAELEIRNNLTRGLAIRGGASATELRSVESANTFGVITNTSNLYSNEEKIRASQRFYQLEQQQRTEDEAEEKRYLNTRLAELKAERDAEVIASREADALIMAAHREAGAEFKAQLLSQEEAQAASQTKRKAIAGNISSTIQNTTAGIAVVEVASGIMASKFNYDLQTIANNTYMSSQEFENMKKVTLDLSKSTGSSFDSLAQGYRFITDFNYRNADATHILTVANKEAVATNTQVEATTKTLASTMHIFGAEAKDADRYMGMLDLTASRGSITIQQLIDNVGPALAIAANYHLKIEDTLSALSTLSLHGFNASEVTTQIKGIINHIGDASKGAREFARELEKITGVPLSKDFTAQGLTQKGLQGVLADIQRATGGNPELIGKLIPALRGGVGANTLANSLKEMTELHTQLQSVTNANTKVDEKFNAVMETSAQKVKSLVQTIEADFIPVGEKAIALFEKWEPYTLRFSNFVLGLMENFQKLPEPIQQAITVIGGLSLLNKFTGIGTALAIPEATIASLKMLTSIFPRLTLVAGESSLALGVAGATEASVGTAMTAFAASSGPVFLVIAALTALSWEGYNVIDMYNKMAKAQDDAAKKDREFAEQKEKFKNHSVGGLITVETLEASQKLSDKQIELKSLRFSDDAVNVAKKRILQKEIADLELQIKTNRDKLNSGTLHETKFATADSYGIPNNGRENSANPLGDVVASTNSYISDSVNALMSGKGLTLDMVNAYIEADKAAEKARKQAEAARKEAEKRYAHEVNALHLIINLKEKSEELDAHHERTKVESLFQKGGSLALLSGKKGNLLSIADLADAMEHQNYLDKIIQQGKDRLTIGGMSSNEQKAIEMLGGGSKGLTGFNSLGQDQRSDFLKQVRDLTVSGETKKAKEELADLNLQLASLGNPAKLAAIQSVAQGSAKVWKDLSDTLKADAIDAEKEKLSAKGILSLQEKYNVPIANDTTEKETEVQKAIKDINELKQNLGGLAYSYEILKRGGEGAIIAEAELRDQEIAAKDALVQRKILNETVTESNNHIKELQTNMVMMYSPSQKAVIQWEDTNRKAIKELHKDIGDLADEYVFLAEAQIASNVNREAVINTYNNASTSLVDSLKQANAIKSSDPFQIWLQSYMQLQQTVSADGGISYTIGLPTGTDVGIMRQIYDQIYQIQQQIKLYDMIKSGESGLASSVMGGLNAAFNPDQSVRSSLQQTLLSQKQQYMEYQVAEAQYKQKYPNSGNDPYIQRLKDLQNMIDGTQNKIDKMGNSLVNTFNRAFDSIVKSFENTLQKMAMEYLQSQLLQYIQRQAGNPFGGSTGASKGSVGLISTGINLGLQAWGMFGGGGSTGGTGVDYSVAPLPDYGGSVGTGGVWDTVNTTALSRSVMIPGAGFSSRRSAGSAQMIQHNQITINTPDTQTMRRSRATIQQEFAKIAAVPFRK